MSMDVRLLSRPRFVADESSIERHNSGLNIDWQVLGALTSAYREGAVRVTIRAPGADQNDVGDTVIAVVALTAPVPAGTLLRFGEGRYAYTVEDAEAGENVITVEALLAAMVVGESGYFVAGGQDAGLWVPAGTVMGKVASGLSVPRAIAPVGSAWCIIETDARNQSKVAALSGYGALRGGALFENLLPEASGDPAVLPALYKAELQVAGVCSFRFQQYRDNR